MHGLSGPAARGVLLGHGRAHVLCTARQISTPGPPGTALGSLPEGGPRGLVGRCQCGSKKRFGPERKDRLHCQKPGFLSCLCPGAPHAVILLPHLKSELTTHTSGSSRGTKSTQALSLSAGPPDLSFAHSNHMTKSHPQEPQLPRGSPPTQKRGDCWSEIKPLRALPSGGTGRPPPRLDGRRTGDAALETPRRLGGSGT